MVEGINQTKEYLTLCIVLKTERKGVHFSHPIGTRSDYDELRFLNVSHLGSVVLVSDEYLRFAKAMVPVVSPYDTDCPHPNTVLNIVIIIPDEAFPTSGAKPFSYSHRGSHNSQSKAI